MDPMSQGLIGTTICQVVSKPKKIIAITIISFLSALAPDLDVFIKSADDPILFLEYHRQFTHSIFFIPIGGLICALFFNFLAPKSANLSFKEIYFFCTLSYASHGVIDAFTSYGTQLFWPFTNERISWNLISVVDPIFTIPILFMVIFTLIKNNKTFSYFALGWIFIYFSFSSYQQTRAHDVISNIINDRKHLSKRLIIKPSFANIILWKTLYEHDNYYYIDAIRLGINPTFINGAKIKKLDIAESFAWLDISSQQAKDIERFRWFSDNYLSQSFEHPLQIMDVRFTSLPHTISPLWSIELNPDANIDDHIKYVTNRKIKDRRYDNLLKIILNE